MIPKHVKSNPVPEAIYKKNLKDIEDEKRKRREEIREKAKKEWFDEGKIQQFEFETEKRPTNIDKLIEEKEKQERQIKEHKTVVRPPPQVDPSQQEIKLNAAAILKDEAIMKRLQNKEDEYLKGIELNMRDSQEFERWRKEQEAKEQAEQLERQERKRVEMQLAREAAMKAVEEKNEGNRKQVEQMKQEVALLIPLSK